MKIDYTKQAGMLSTSDLKSFKGKLLYWTFFAILVIVAIVSLLPAIWTVSTSFKDTQEIYNSFTFFPKEFSFGKAVTRITESWEYLQLGDAFINTVIMSVGDLLMNVVVCGLGGYVLSKLKPKGYKFIFVLVVWTMMMPSQIRLVPNYITYLHFPFVQDNGMGINLLDTYWPMWFAAGADTFAVLLYKNAFDGLSNSYVEAAKIDGCSNIGIFLKIMLPLAMPVVIYQSINVLNGAWSNFFTPLLVLDEKTVLPLALYRLRSDPSVEMNTMFMSFVFASLPTFILFLIFQKRIMGGVNVGGVKG